MTHVSASSSDEQLVAAIADGSRDAVAKLYDRHGRSVYGIALRVLRDPELCEEVVQDTFLRAWNAASSYDAARARPLTWLMTIAHNSAIDRLRRENVRPLQASVALLDHDGAGIDESSNPANVAVARSRAVIVREQLALIPPRQREAIVLAYFGGLTQVEVAEQLGEAVGTIKTRMFHGMRRLRELLDEAGVRDGA